MMAGIIMREFVGANTQNVPAPDRCRRDGLHLADNRYLLRSGADSGTVDDERGYGNSPPIAGPGR